MTNTPNTGRKRTRSERAARVEEMRRQQRAAERRRRSTWVSAAVAVAVVIVVIIVIAVQSSRNQTGPSTTPANVTDRVSFVRGQADAPVTVTLYEDFQCPICREFEASTGSTIDRYVRSGTIKVQYRPIAFLDRESTTQYSTRALNAAACVANAAGIPAFTKFHDLLYAHQPPEGSAGLPNSQLASFAAQSGATGPAVKRCINSGRFNGWTRTVTDKASKAGVNGTPTVRVDGKTLPNTVVGDPNVLVQAIQQAS